MWVGSQSTDERLDEVPERFNFCNDAIAEGKGFDAAKANISLCLSRCHLEAELVSASEVEGLGVQDLCVSKNDRIVAQMRLWLSRGHVHVKFGV